MREGEKRKWGIRALLTGVAAAWLIYDMASATEARGQALTILYYVGLALCLIGAVGSAWKYFSAE